MVTYYRDALACRFDPGAADVWPKRVEITDVLPNTPSGRVQKLRPASEAGLMPFDFAADQESLAEQAALISGILAASGRQQQDRWRPAIATGGGSRSALPDPDGRAIIGKYEERR